MLAIKTENLTKSFGNLNALSNLTLEVQEGELYGFIGPNGAGKSTLIKILLNFLYPTKGKAFIFNKDVTKESKRIKEQIGYVPSEVNFYPHMTSKQLIEATMKFYNCNDTKKLGYLVDNLNIQLDKKFSQLSLGNKKKVALACALVHSPKLIILDEPTSGLDPLIKSNLFELLIAEQKDNNATIFISSHNLEEVQEFCTKVAFIKNGTIIKTKDLTKKEEAKKIVKLCCANPVDLTKIQCKIINSNDNYVEFEYKQDINCLLKFLSSYQITDITINDFSLQDEFISYYKGDE